MAIRLDLDARAYSPEIPTVQRRFPKTQLLVLAVAEVVLVVVLVRVHFLLDVLNHAVLGDEVFPRRRRPIFHIGRHRLRFQNSLWRQTQQHQIQQGQRSHSDPLLTMRQLLPLMAVNRNDRVSKIELNSLARRVTEVTFCYKPKGF